MADDADDGSFVVLVDISPGLIRGCLLFVGLDDTLLLELESSLSASKLSFLCALDFGGIVHESIYDLNGVLGFC